MPVGVHRPPATLDASLFKTLPNCSVLASVGLDHNVLRPAPSQTLTVDTRPSNQEHFRAASSEFKNSEHLATFSVVAFLVAGFSTAGMVSKLLSWRLRHAGTKRSHDRKVCRDTPILELRSGG